jgi:tRNA A-37 threonylcarbamoyl transferase component Bud32
MVPDLEVAIMRYARDRGYPVPEIHDASGSDLVLERVDGEEMARDILGRPWRLRRHARTLAELHRRLHAIAPPLWLRGDGNELAHCDLHPRNVLLGSRGPMVIDWANARRADGAFDVALSAIVTGGASLSAPLSLVRDLFVREFLRHFPRPEWEAAWDRAIAFRRADANVGDAERARLAHLRF